MTEGLDGNRARRYPLAGVMSYAKEACHATCYRACARNSRRVALSGTGHRGAHHRGHWAGDRDSGVSAYPLLPWEEAAFGEDRAEPPGAPAAALRRGKDRPLRVRAARRSP